MLEPGSSNVLDTLEQAAPLANWDCMIRAEHYSSTADNLSLVATLSPIWQSSCLVLLLTLIIFWWGVGVAYVNLLL